MSGAEKSARPDSAVEAEMGEVYVISVAAELTGMHAQTLRTYDRIGLVTPQRSSGGGRRYSHRDVDQLREIQRLSQEEGVNLAGIKEIIRLGKENDRLRDELATILRLLTNRPPYVRGDLPAPSEETRTAAQ